MLLCTAQVTTALNLLRLLADAAVVILSKNGFSILATERILAAVTLLAALFAARVWKREHGAEESV